MTKTFVINQGQICGGGARAKRVYFRRCMFCDASVNAGHPCFYAGARDLNDEELQELQATKASPSTGVGDVP